MKKILVACLIIIFSMGNICFAQNANGANDHNAYYINDGRVYQDADRSSTELSSRDRNNKHHKHHKNHKHHKHHDDDDHGKDIIKGIIILGVLKEILD